MDKVRVLLGLDCDRPRTSFRHQDDYGRELDEVVGYIRGLTEQWSRAGISWTMFLCGQFVQAAAEISGSMCNLRKLLGVSYEGCEIACHSYAHRPFGPVVGRPELVPSTLDEIHVDLAENTQVLEWLTGYDARQFGFRAPYGFSSDDLVDEVFAEIATFRRYSSSVLRTRRGGICPPLMEADQPRQPFRHRCGIWEVPSHGWHDTVFAGLSPTSSGPDGSVTAWDYYGALLKDACDLSDRTAQPLYVGLVLHPIAMARYDPTMTLLDRLLNSINGAAFRSYADAVSELEAMQEPTRAPGSG